MLILPASPHENDSVTTTEESIQRPANPPIYVKLLEENSDWRATGIIHDFNNQLAIILSHCSIALTKLPLDSKARANLERSVRATKRAAELSSQLHVGRAAQSDNFTQIDFNNLVRETVEDLEPQLTAHAIVEQHYASDLPPISAYCLLLQRALFNILSNAAEAMHGQAGKIAITTREVVVTNDEYVKAPRQLPPGTYVLWEVSDTGQGMTQDTLDHIFEPYYSTKSIGAGLGLTIVQHIAQLHHSTIYIRSKAKEGTTFQLFIPVNADSTLTH